MKVRIYLPAALLLLAATAGADELYLKDGSKIVGTIVGFEGSSFKVQTSYGFAVVEKDKIVKIIPAGGVPPKPESKAELKKESAADAKKKPGAKTVEASEKTPAVAPTTSQPAPAPSDVSNRPDDKPRTASAAAGQPAAPPAAAKPPAPPVNREEVRGNEYRSEERRVGKSVDL